MVSVPRHTVRALRRRLFGVVLLAAAGLVSSALRADETGVPVPRGDRVLDLVRGIEWRRCALGQKWTATECAGTPMGLALADVPAMIRVVDPRGGEGWRLPTRAEFKALGCIGCRGGAAQLMPGLPAATFWTSEANATVPGRRWSVDLKTLGTFGRNEPTRRLHVILVRDR